MGRRRRRLVNVVRHLAVLLFGCSVALAAWPPASRLVRSAGGGHVAMGFDGDRLVAEAGEGEAGRFTPAYDSLRHFPGGVVVARATGGATHLRVSMPVAVNVAAAGFAWVLLLLSGARNRQPRDGSTGAAGASVGAALVKRRSSAASQPPIFHAASFVWWSRYAAGAALLVGAFYCVYAMPRSTDGSLFTDVQALHVCAASFSVYVATMLITFD